MQFLRYLRPELFVSVALTVTARRTSEPATWVVPRPDERGPEVRPTCPSGDIWSGLPADLDGLRIEVPSALPGGQDPHLDQLTDHSSALLQGGLFPRLSRIRTGQTHAGGLSCRPTLLGHQGGDLARYAGCQPGERVEV